MSRICACGCGGTLAGLRVDARYQSEACKKRAQRAASRDKAGTGPHPLQEVRDQAALDKHTRDLNGLIRQAIIDAIKTRGECHADDLIPLYPEGEVDRCRELATRQFASLRSGKRPLIAERERRPSSIPARKRAKSGVYVFTRYGRERLAGLDAHQEERKGTRNEVEQSLTAPSTGRGPLSFGSVPHGAGTPESVESGEINSGIGQSQGKSGKASPPSTSAADPGASPDSLIRLEDMRKAPSAYDPWAA